MLYIIPEKDTAYFTEDRDTATELSKRLDSDLIVRENTSLIDIVAYFGMYVREKDKPLPESKLISMKNLVGYLTLEEGEKETKFTKHPELKKAFKIHSRRALEDYLEEAETISQLDESDSVRNEWERKMSHYREIIKDLFLKRP